MIQESISYAHKLTHVQKLVFFGCIFVIGSVLTVGFTRDFSSISPLGSVHLTSETGLPTIRYKEAHYFLPHIFAVGRSEGVTFLNEASYAVSLHLEPADSTDSTEKISETDFEILPGHLHDVRFNLAGMWEFYDVSHESARGIIYIR